MKRIGQERPLVPLGYVNIPSTGASGVGCLLSFFLPFFDFGHFPTSGRLLNVDLPNWQRVILLTPRLFASPSKDKCFASVLWPCGKVGGPLRPKPAKERSAQTTSRDQGRVLLITDESDVPYRKSLESAGLKIVGVSAGTAALIALRRSRPHIVIANTSSKGLSTDELGHMLGQMHDGVPLILVGFEVSTAKLRQEAILAGAFDYFQIPAEVELLAVRDWPIAGDSVWR